MMSRLSLVAGLSVLLVGCGQGKKPSTAVAPPPATQDAAQPEVSQPPAPESPAARISEPPGSGLQTPAPGQPPVVQPVMLKDDGHIEATLAQLTQALRKFSMEQRRVPKSFSEVIAAGYVGGMPAPPPGKQFVVDAKHVQVVLGKQ